MPADYTIDRALGLVTSQAWGLLSLEDLQQHGQRMRADPDFRPDLRQLWDLSMLTGTTLNSSELTGIAKQSFFAATTRRAILAPTDFAFGMARMFQMLRESQGETGIRVFRDRAEAIRWLETGELPVQVSAQPAARNPGSSRSPH